MGRLARWPPPFLALAIEAEWRKRAIGVVPAQPKARSKGQRPYHCSEGQSTAMPYVGRASSGAANRISAQTPTNPPPTIQKICRQISEGTASRVMP